MATTLTRPHQLWRFWGVRAACRVARSRCPGACRYRSLSRLHAGQPAQRSGSSAPMPLAEALFPHIIANVIRDLVPEHLDVALVVLLELLVELHAPGTHAPSILLVEVIPGRPVQLLAERLDQVVVRVGHGLRLAD